MARRVVMTSQKGIRILAPDTIDDAGTVRSITPVYVFDVRQTQELPARAAERAAARTGSATPRPDSLSHRLGDPLAISNLSRHVPHAEDWELALN